MPWQRFVSEVGLEVDPVSGRLAYDEINVHIMRQQGKTTLDLAVEVQRCLGFKPTPQLVAYAAQSGVAAREKLLEEQAPLLRKSPIGKFITVRRQSGHEALVFRNRSRIVLHSGTEDAGHGPVLDLGIIDEAWAYSDARHEQAMVPAMQTRKNAQLWVCSTAGTEDSTYFKAKVDAGRARVEAGLTDTIAYFEWSFDPSDDPYSPDTWRRRMPALGHTLEERAIASAAERLPERDFLRAYGNLWLPKTALDPVIDLDTWAHLFDRRSRAKDPVGMSIDVSPDRSSAAIGIAGARKDGRIHVELADYRPSTRWVVERVKAMRDTWKPCAIALDPSGPAGSLVPELEQAGIELMFIGSREMAAACGGFYDAAMTDQLRHLDQVQLNAAIGGARKRPIGNAWGWARTDAAVDDICPLVAVTIARYAYTVHGAESVYDVNKSFG